MRRWNLLSLVALLVVALVAAVVITPRGALAAPSSLMRPPAPSTSFKGKVVAKDTDTHYFVFTFTCAPPPGSTTSILTGDWTYKVSSTQSFSGTTGTSGPACALVSTTTGTGVSYSTTSIPLLFNRIPVTTSPLGTPAMLSLSLTNIMASKTFFGTFVSSAIAQDRASSVTSSSPCVAAMTSDPLVIPTTPTATTVSGFSLVARSFSTLNLSAQ